jgi:hypothetical protein
MQKFNIKWNSNQHIELVNYSSFNRYLYVKIIRWIKYQIGFKLGDRNLQLLLQVVLWYLECDEKCVWFVGVFIICKMHTLKVKRFRLHHKCQLGCCNIECLIFFYLSGLNSLDVREFCNVFDVWKCNMHRCGDIYHSLHSLTTTL